MTSSRFTRLRELSAEMAKYRLVGSCGIMVAVDADGRVTQFSSDAAAEFFVRAGVLVPAMLDELETLSDGHNTLARLEGATARVGALEAALEDAHARTRQAEQECSRLRGEGARLASAARAGRRAAQTALELQKQVAALQVALQERGVK